MSTATGERQREQRIHDNRIAEHQSGRPHPPACSRHRRTRLADYDRESKEEGRQERRAEVRQDDAEEHLQGLKVKLKTGNPRVRGPRRNAPSERRPALRSEPATFAWIEPLADVNPVVVERETITEHEVTRLFLAHASSL